MLIDTNCFLGPWPFLPVPDRNGHELTAHLQRYGVNRALVSHLGAAFLPEPMSANRQLWQMTRGIRALEPVPIINPALASWRAQLEECERHQPLHAVRLMPAFHNYGPAHPRLQLCMAELARAEIKVVLQVRVEDERNRYFGLKVVGLAEADIDEFLRRFARQTVLCVGLYHGEIVRLAAQHANFLADISFAESLTTLDTLRKKLPARRLVFGSGCPILSVPAQTAKILLTGLSAREREQIAAGNVRRFLAGRP